MNLNKRLTFIRALAIPFRVAPLENGLQLLSLLINIALAPISVLVTAYFIDTALTAAAEGGGFSRVILPLAAIAAWNIYGYIEQPLLQLVNMRRMIKTRLLLRVPMLTKRARLEYKHIENSKTVDLLKRVWEGPEWQINGMLDNLRDFLWLAGTVVSYLVILLINAPLAGIALIVFNVPMIILAIKAGKARYQANKEATLDQRLAWNYSWTLGAREAAIERNLFGYADYLDKKFRNHFEISRKHLLKVNFLWFIRSKASAIILGIVSSAGLFIMAPSVATGAISVGLFISLQRVLFTTVGWLGWSLPYNFQQFAAHREFIKEFNEFIHLSETPEAEVLPAKTPIKFETIEFKDVTFSYPGMEKTVLKNMSLKMEKGKHYAFVGINGAGKTTLTKLLTRLYENYSGEILLNGKSLREWTMAEIKSCFCAVFQDFAQYDITVAENVSMGKINGATDDEVDNALELAGFDKKAAELKNGKDTLLGKTHDDGVDLSGGQWQRLAFARAVISPAPVKILDEPTASLDPVAEGKMYEQFESISRGFTTIFISHRLASAKMADVIFVMEDGKVAEQGDHTALMAQKGIYAEMFESQQSWYINK